MDDKTLQQYVDEIWKVYDGGNNWGFLVNEKYFDRAINDLWKRMGYSGRIPNDVIMGIFKGADLNKD